MFKLLGAILALYTVFAVINGAVYAKAGVWGRSVSKDASPEYFWTVIVIYAALSVALFTVF